VSLAIATASASSLKRKSGATGPKVSSRATFMLVFISVMSVGSKKRPPSLWPPSTTLPPWATASATCSSTFLNPCSSMSGPMFTPASVPLPTLSALIFSPSFAANAS